MGAQRPQAGHEGRHRQEQEELQELRAQQVQLQEEFTLLLDCLCASGVLTPAELAAQRKRRQGAARVSWERTVLAHHAAARQLAEALGLTSVCHLSASSSALSATFKQVLFPAGEVPLLPEQKRIAACKALGGLSTPEQPQPRSVFTLRFFSWPFGSSSAGAQQSTCVPAAAVSAEVPTGAETETAAAEATLAEGVQGGHCCGRGAGTSPRDPEEALQPPETPELQEPPAPGASSSSAPASSEAPVQPQSDGTGAGKCGPRPSPGALEFLEPRDGNVLDEPSGVLGEGGAATLLAMPRPPEQDTCDERQLFFGELFLPQDTPSEGHFCETQTVSQPAIARPLETLVYSETELAECQAEFLRKQRTEEASREQESPKSLEEQLVAIPQIACSIGRAAGLTGARQISQVSRSFSEGLVPYLTELLNDLPSIFVCGGSCGIATDSAERFCPRTGRWESLPPMCVPRRACAAASVGGRFYVVGGVEVPRFSASVYSDSLQQPWVFENKHRPECFDPVTNTWSLLPPMSRPYTHASAVSAGSLLYVFGGLSFGSVLDQAQRFDPARQLWESLEPMPTPRFECSAAAAGGLLYVLGGANTCGEPLAVAECYQPSSGLWRSLPRMRQARYGGAAATLGGRVYAIGGHGIWENLSAAEVFDPEAECWLPLPQMSVRRNHCGASTACGKIYVFGGHTSGQDIITVERFDPQTGSWDVAGLMVQPRSHCMTATVQP